MTSLIAIVIILAACWSISGACFYVENYDTIKHKPIHLRLLIVFALGPFAWILGFSAVFYWLGYKLLNAGDSWK